MRNEAQHLAGIMNKTCELPTIKKMEVPKETWKTIAKDVVGATLLVVSMIAGIIVILLSI